jgi:hypothetical protein
MFLFIASNTYKLDWNLLQTWKPDGFLLPHSQLPGNSINAIQASKPLQAHNKFVVGYFPNMVKLKIFLTWWSSKV